MQITRIVYFLKQSSYIMFFLGAVIMLAGYIRNQAPVINIGVMIYTPGAVGALVFHLIPRVIKEFVSAWSDDEE